MLTLPVYVLQFLVPPSGEKGGSILLGGCLQLLGFCTFESCVGIFWPSIMKMRSQYIPEEARSTIMNFFRIPLNLFVCVVLYNVSNQKNLRETPISRIMFFFIKKNTNNEGTQGIHKAVQLKHVDK